MSSWRSFLLRIGDNCPDYGTNTDFKEHIETCFGIVRREIEHSNDEILPFFLQCTEQLPHKIPLYGTLVGLLNLENEKFVRELVEVTQSNLQNALDSGNCNRIRILMRFLTTMMCSNVLQPSSLVVVFETLLSSAATTVDEEKGSTSWQARADFYVTCILSCLPWGGAELIEQVPDDIDRVMVGVEAYLSIRKQYSDKGYSAFKEDEIEKDGGEKDFLEDLWYRIQALAQNGWKIDSVPRPQLSFEAQLVAGKSHDLSAINCPEQQDRPSGINYGKQKHDAELMYPQRLRRLNIFPANKFEDLQLIDRFVVEEYLLDILLFFNGCRKECASYMVGLPVPFRYEYLMAETIFAQLLLLPQPPFKPIYYTLVIMDLCKALPGAFPVVVAGAVRVLFEKIGELDMECRSRLILWFSHHLSNFQFIWPWDEWSFVLELPKWAPQRVFVQEVLERETRLSYWDKIKQSIENASSLEELLPPKGGPNFKYSAEAGEENTEHALSKELSSMVKSRKSAREVTLWIEESLYPVHGLELTLKVVLQTLLDIGSKSVTHLITVLERYGQVIAKMFPDHDKQVFLITEVSSYWTNSTQMTAITIDRMMGYRLISNLSIVQWVFSPENIKEFHISDRPWEILGNAINKTYNRICDLRKEIASLQNSIVSAEEASSKATKEFEIADSKLTLVDGEPVLGENPVRLKRLKLYAEKAKDAVVSAHDNLEAKEALLARALKENEALFISLYGKFSNVLNELLLSDASLDRKIGGSQVEPMAVGPESSTAMEVDSEKTEISESNGERATPKYNLGEKEQWCVSVLGYVKSFSRQYASEIWPHIEKLDFEVFTGDVHPLFIKEVYAGLHRSIDV